MQNLDSYADMRSDKRLVLDANILIRAILGNKVRELLTRFVGRVDYFTPEVCFADARHYLPQLLEKRGVALEPALAILDSIEVLLVQSVAESCYLPYEPIAKARLLHRDVNDWPILATALTLDCAIWTEDTDFFGTGVATWTSDKVILYLDE